MTVWQVPVAERGIVLPRRLLRERPDLPPLPRVRDLRPSRARRERMPEPLRAWGAAPRTSSVTTP